MQISTAFNIPRLLIAKQRKYYLLKKVTLVIFIKGETRKVKILPKMIKGMMCLANNSISLNN